MAAACQVDFYVLQDETQSADLLACKLALMAWEQGKRIMVLAASGTECKRLDELMWNTRKDVFFRMPWHTTAPPA